MPSKIKKKELTTAQAAKQWEQAKRDIAAAKPLLEESAAVLMAYFEKSGKRAYKDRIGLVDGAARTVLDQAKVREFLGPRLSEFQKQSTPSPSLTLLEKS